MDDDTRIVHDNIKRAHDNMKRVHDNMKITHDNMKRALDNMKRALDTLDAIRLYFYDNLVFTVQIYNDYIILNTFITYSEFVRKVNEYLEQKGERDVLENDNSSFVLYGVLCVVNK